MCYCKFIPCLLIIALAACGQTPGRKAGVAAPAAGGQLLYISFGYFCGECAGRCAPMYRYNLTGNAHTLFTDTTDSYFRTYRKPSCNTPVNDTTQFRVIDDLVQHIPRRLVETGKAQETFGCPDCSDGCGLYFELGKDTITRRFYIDYQTENLNGDIKEFAGRIKNTLSKLHKR